MARPKKKGLDYWPCDVDFFLDEKVAAIVGEFGLKGESIVIHLLCAIYRDGYYTMWTEMMQMKLLRELPDVSAGLLSSVLNRLVKWGFFDGDLFDSHGVLTSKAIQRRYFSVARRRSKEDCKFLLGNEDSSESPSSLDGQVLFSDDGIEGFSDNNSLLSVVFDEKTPERKENKTIIKETISSDIVKKKVDERKQDFYNSLIPYVEKYGAPMIRSFFDYWSEISDGGTKMKWEKVRDQKNGTWSLAGRLATWKRNERKFSRDSSSGAKGISISQAIMSVAQPDLQAPPAEFGVSITKLIGNGFEENS